MADAHRGRRRDGWLGAWRPAGLVTSALGALLVALSFTVLDWYDDRVLGAPITFAGLRDDLDALQRPGFSLIYFDWLAWLALVVAVVLAVSASRRSSGRRWRIAAVGFAVLTTASGYLALWSFFAYARNSGASDVGVFQHAAPGVYVALAGFVMLGAGAVIG